MLIIVPVTQNLALSIILCSKIRGSKPDILSYKRKHWGKIQQYSVHTKDCSI